MIYMVFFFIKLTEPSVARSISRNSTKTDRRTKDDMGNSLRELKQLVPKCTGTAIGTFFFLKPNKRPWF